MRAGREVAVFVRRGNGLLLLSDPDRRSWDIVVGAAEAGESTGAAARRALREVTGLVPLAPIRRLDVVACETYVADAPDDWEPRLDQKNAAFRWASAADAEHVLHRAAAIEALHVLAVSAGSSEEEARELVVLINARHGSRWSIVRRIGGGSQQGAYELVDERGSHAVLKWHTRHLPARQLVETATLIERARARGWPTPRWLTFGALPAEGAYVVEELIGGQPLEAIDDTTLERLLAANRLQAGLAPNAKHDWSAYVWRVAFEDPNGDLGRLRSRADTADFADRLERRLQRGRGVRLPTGDLVHGDFTPRNVIVRDGLPYLVDAAHAGGGTRAYDLAVLAVDAHWRDQPTSGRESVLREAHALVGTDGLMLCLAARMIVLLEWGGRHWPAEVADAVVRCDELLDLVPARA